MAKKEGISIFDSARSRTPSASVSKKDDKEVVFVDGLEAKLLELDVVKAQVKDLTAQEKSLNSEIKDIAKEKFVELYQSKRANPNTFLIRSGSGCVMVIPSDAYLKIDSEARANELIDAYGEDAVEVDEQFIFNNDVLERNMKAIEKAIKESKSITDDDKRDLIDRKVKYSVAKGFIDKLGVYGKNIELVMNDVQPTISLKSCGSRMEDGGELDGDFMGNIYGDGGDGYILLGITDLPTQYGVTEKWLDGKLVSMGLSVNDKTRNKLLRELQSRFNSDWQNNVLGFAPDKKSIVWLEWDEDAQKGLEEKNSEGDYVAKVGSNYVPFTDKNWDSYFESIADDDEYRKGGRVYETGRAYKRDRAYKSNQPHELAYRRKTRPKNPRYKKDTSFFADGGGVEKFNIGDKVKVVKGANKGVKGVISNTDSDFFGDYTIDVRGHKLYGFKADSLIKLPKYKMMADGGGVGKYADDDDDLFFFSKVYKSGGVDNLLKDIDEGDVITIFKLKEYANDLIEGYRSIIKEEEYTILIDYDKEIAYYFTQDGADLTFVREEEFRTLDLDDKDDYADGGAVKTVFTKDGVEVEKGTDKYKGHIFYHSDGVGYMCLGYFPNLDDCKYRNMETGTEVVGCMDGFYYNNPMMAHGGMMHGGKISTATLEAMVGRKLNGWNDDVVIYNGAKYQKLYLQSFYVMA